jgi:hypothetical protein
MKYYRIGRMEKESKGKNINNRITTYLSETFREKKVAYVHILDTKRLKV